MRSALRSIPSDNGKELDRDIDEMLDGSLNISKGGDDRCLSCQVPNLALKALIMCISVRLSNRFLVLVDEHIRFINSESLVVSAMSQDILT